MLVLVVRITSRTIGNKKQYLFVELLFLTSLLVLIYLDITIARTKKIFSLIYALRKIFPLHSLRCCLPIFVASKRQGFRGMFSIASRKRYPERYHSDPYLSIVSAHKARGPHGFLGGCVARKTGPYNALRHV